MRCIDHLSQAAPKHCAASLQNNRTEQTGNCLLACFACAYPVGDACRHVCSNTVSPFTISDRRCMSHLGSRHNTTFLYAVVQAISMPVAPGQCLTAKLAAYLQSCRWYSPHK